ncbi:MAG TPA: hypothetical protein VKO16_05980, partial [Polyangia bacterium]|nr:hypothetical protein [Polyangia bacterium]
FNPPAATPPGRDEVRDQDLLGGGAGGPKLSSDVAPDDPLRIGGQLYLRALARSTQDQNVRNIAFSAPSLVDGYFDARPNDRVRGFILARMSFDSTLPAMAPSVSAVDQALQSTSVPQISNQQVTRGPTAALDQLWVRFDIAHQVFVTVGRQHVRWGTGRIWTPTDFLHPQLRNPLAAFDARTGLTMVKLHLPIESRGWNLYAFTLLEAAPQVDSTGRTTAGSDRVDILDKVGGALRAEVVLGAAELGVDTVLYGNRRPKAGADLSFGIGDLDLYADAGFRAGSEIAIRRYNAGDVPLPTPAPGMTLSQADVDGWLDQKYPVAPASGIKPQVVLGGTYSLKYNDNDVFTITGEYFYNSVGYDDPHVYPGLFFSGSFQYFYTGRQYGSLSFVADAPYSWNYTTFTLTTLGNFSDQTFVTRLDYSLVLLTHLRFEAFGALNYGRDAGEFRLGSPAFTVATDTGSRLIPPQAPQLFQLGLGLRISL